MKIVLETLGCKLNQAETEMLAKQFIEAGHTIVPSVKDADIFILNTCTVTHTADSKARQLLRQVHRKNPDAILAVTGCYAERDPEILRQVEGVKSVTANRDKMRLPEILEEAGFLINTPGYQDTVTFSEGSSRTRTFIKIQDGCSNFCTYCIVPFVRREETSVPADEIVRYVNNRVSEGFKEAVLTGTEVGTYQDGSVTLVPLLKRLLDETGIERLRLSSLQPDEITTELLELWADPRMCPHFHISLQSGSDTILKKMNRRYSTHDYRKTIELIRSMVQDVAITTDIIAGFPGETEQDFQDSLTMCRNSGFARIHVFPYSKRPETAAAKMPGQVRDSIKTQRNQNLGTLAAECASIFRKQFQGYVMDVLWEQKSGGLWSGYTGNYIRVYAESTEDLTNRITPVQLDELFKDGIQGLIIK